MNEMTIASQLARIADALEALATVKEERGKIPHTPLKEKGETREKRVYTRAREGLSSLSSRPRTGDIRPHFRRRCKREKAFHRQIFGSRRGLATRVRSRPLLKTP